MTAELLVDVRYSAPISSSRINPVASSSAASQMNFLFVTIRSGALRYQSMFTEEANARSTQHRILRSSTYGWKSTALNESPSGRSYGLSFD